MYIKRHLENIVLKTSESFPVVLVTGSRQVGKTTMLTKIASSGRRYISLDDPLARELAKSDPGLFIQRYAPPVLIDEIQYAPELLIHIKMHVDKNKRMGDFWLTGSQAFHMMKGVSESLAGRVGILNMTGLSYSEIACRPNKVFLAEPSGFHDRVIKDDNLRKVFNRIHKGAFPALYERKQEPEIFYSSYINTYVQRDIRDLTQVADELSFIRFLQACAARTSKMVNYSELAKDAGISSPTAKQWMSILISSGIVTLVEPYFNNALKRIVKAPNMYFMDTGLCAYLTRWTNPEALEVSAMAGAFLETYAVSEIMKSYINAGRRPPVFYYRDSDQKEIDLILEINGTLYPIEIKKSTNPGKNSIRHFSALEKTGMNIGGGTVVCLCNDIVPVDRNNSFLPISVI
ncbi:MAG: ATP-binding protein [Clostridia bacterium]|nr:ATP-binding protein [Clostridia bacterium]